VTSSASISRFMTSTPAIMPPRLRPGDLIGVISPAGPVMPSDLQPGLDLLGAKGYRMREAPHLYDRHGYLAGDDKARLADLHDMFHDQEIAAVFCARGGYGCLRLLDKIDYRIIREHPKILLGYSDVTALLMAVYKETGMIAFHGPMVRGLATITEASLEALFHILSLEEPLLLSPMEGKPLVSGEVEGPLLGGNLSLICHLAGTRFLPSLEGAILFIEDCGEPLYRIDRMLTHLSLAGLLNGIAGLIAGEFTNCGDAAEIDRLLIDAAATLNIPLITGFPLGHGQNNLTLPVGMPVHLDAGRMTLRTTGACVR
jgi:muramoyltetrapeptide carboxypeptidase